MSGASNKNSVKPIGERSFLGRALKEKKKIFSIELMPPQLSDLDPFLSRCSELERAGIEFVSIPDGPRGLTRVSSLHLANYIRSHYRLEPIPHLACRGRNQFTLESDFMGAHINGIRDVLLITGDPASNDNSIAKSTCELDSIDLTRIASQMNADFVIGVALNPNVQDRHLEIERFKQKIEAGADFAITQPIFDIEAFKNFIADIGEVKIPILMGIWPIVSLKNAEFLHNEVSGAYVPEFVFTELRKLGNNSEDTLKLGIEIARQTIAKAEPLVAGFHISTPLNRVDVALSVIKR